VESYSDLNTKSWDQSYLQFQGRWIPNNVTSADPYCTHTKFQRNSAFHNYQ